jgi:hypothetical protein
MILSIKNINSSFIRSKSIYIFNLSLVSSHSTDTSYGQEKRQIIAISDVENKYCNQASLHPVHCTIDGLSFEENTPSAIR